MRAGVAAVLVVCGWVSGVSAFASDPPRASQVDPYVARPRVVVLTDIANEPDDQMSLVRFLVYSNQFDVEGLVATTSTWMKNKVRPDVIRTVLDAYEQVQPNLLKHAAGLPDRGRAARRRRGTGQPGYGMAAVGPGQDVAGRRADRPGRATGTTRGRCGCSVWGGANTLAQALARRPRHAHARGGRGRSSRSCASTRSPTRTTPARGSGASSRRSTTSRCRRRGRRGVLGYATWTGISGDRFYRNAPGADFTTFTDEWVNANIRAKGPLGKHYPYPCCIHEGDTPSFLGLIDNGLASAMSPAFGGWGGRYVWRQPTGRRAPSGRRGAIPTRDGTARATRRGHRRATRTTSDQATIWRWRNAFQNDFAARMDWTIKSAARRTTTREVVVNGRAGQGAAILDRREVGMPVTLDATRHARPRRPRAAPHVVLLPGGRQRDSGQPVFAPAHVLRRRRPVPAASPRRRPVDRARLRRGSSSRTREASRPSWCRRSPGSRTSCSPSKTTARRG